jgi:hypothetical protein
VSEEAFATVNDGEEASGWDNQVVSVQLSVSESEIVSDWNVDSRKQSKQGNEIISWSLDD